MRRGARDYIEKPWDDDKLMAAVQTQLELRRALRRSRRLQEENSRLQRRDLPTFIAEAPVDEGRAWIRLSASRRRTRPC